TAQQPHQSCVTILTKSSVKKQQTWTEIAIGTEDHFLVKTNTATAAVNPTALLVRPYPDQTHTALLALRHEETHTSTRTALHQETVAAHPYLSVVVHEALLPSGQEMEATLIEEELAHHHLEGVAS
ncbi:hypothetical protein KCU94_g23356, partial [Aureobasidium melanogenum]